MRQLGAEEMQTLLNKYTGTLLRNTPLTLSIPVPQNNPTVTLLSSNAFIIL